MSKNRLFFIIFVLVLLITYYVLRITFFQPVTIVAPHHNLVKDTRLKFFQQIKPKRLITRHIILIGPDHFSANQNQITYTSSNWNLSNGQVNFDKYLFSKFTSKLINNDNILKDDHAIFNLLPDIKTVWSEAEVIPILVGQKVDPQNLLPLLSDLQNNCGFDCLIIFSVDFSHYLPATLAEVHDAYTLTLLQNLDTNKIMSVEVDSPQSLFLMTNFATSKNAPKWSLSAHTNSGFIAKDPDSETTSHIFGSYSRSYSRIQNLESSFTSVTTPQKYDRSRNQTTLGDRFFYGVDELIVDNSSSFVVSTITTPHKTTKSFLPIKDNLFIRGIAKTELIKQYFDSIPNEPNLTKDYFWGKLIYDRKSPATNKPS